MAWCACKPCDTADPTADTVKVDPAMLAHGKENVRPPVQKQDGAEQAEKLRKQQEEQRKAEREAEERRKQAEAERRRQEEAAAAQAASDAKAAAAAKAAAEQKRAQQEAMAKEEARLTQLAMEESKREEEQRQAEAQERMRAEVEAQAMNDLQHKVTDWAKGHGYQDIHTQKKTKWGKTKYPLHTAVKHGPPDMVEGLVKCGAKKDVTDSKGITPLQLAEKLANGAKRDQMIAALR